MLGILVSYTNQVLGVLVHMVWAPNYIMITASLFGESEYFIYLRLQFFQKIFSWVADKSRIWILNLKNKISRIRTDFARILFLANCDILDALPLSHIEWWRVLCQSGASKTDSTGRGYLFLKVSQCRFALS